MNCPYIEYIQEEYIKIMTEKIIINTLVDRIKLEYANFKGKNSVTKPWKINIKNAEYVLFPLEGGRANFNSTL